MRSSAPRRAARRARRSFHRLTTSSRRGTSKFVQFRKKIGFGGGNQWGTKVVAGELLVAAGMEPFVYPTGTMNGSVIGEFMYAVQSKDPNGITVGVTAFPGAVRGAIWNQLTDVFAAGGVRFIGRLFGV